MGKMLLEADSQILIRIVDRHSTETSFKIFQVSPNPGRKQNPSAWMKEAMERKVEIC